MRQQGTPVSDETPRTPEQRIAEWARQPGAIPNPRAFEFLRAVRQFSDIGYGHMQQLIEWEWQSKGPGSHGPEYFARELSALRSREAALVGALRKAQEPCECKGRVCIDRGFKCRYLRISPCEQCPDKGGCYAATRTEGP